MKHNSPSLNNIDSWSYLRDYLPSMPLSLNNLIWRYWSHVCNNAHARKQYHSSIYQLMHGGCICPPLDNVLKSNDGHIHPPRISGSITKLILVVIYAYFLSILPLVLEAWYFLGIQLKNNGNLQMVFFWKFTSDIAL